MIVSSQNESGKGKKDIIIDQLNQLGLKAGEDFVLYVQEKNPETRIS